MSGPRLTTETIARIRALRVAGHTLRAIQAQTGACRARIIHYTRDIVLPRVPAPPKVRLDIRVPATLRAQLLHMAIARNLPLMALIRELLAHPTARELPPLTEDDFAYRRPALVRLRVDVSPEARAALVAAAGTEPGALSRYVRMVLQEAAEGEDR